MKPHHSIHLAAVTITAAALIAWGLTGREGFTRWPNARLAAADAPPPAGQDELLAAAGFTDEHTPSARPDIKSRFAFGLLPGGADPAHLLSVAAVAAAAASASGATIMWKARHRAPAHPGTSTPGVNR